jgi:hypothetical protein
MKTQPSLETLKKVPEGELTEFIWQFYLDHFSPDSNLSRGFRIAKSTIIFRSEMDNGGIQQYITNHTCTPIADPELLAKYNSKALADVKECLESLKLIGAKESAELLEEALALYERYGWPFDPENRWLDFPPSDEAICERIDERWFNPDGDECSYSRDWRCGENYLRQNLSECVVE